MEIPRIEIKMGLFCVYGHYVGSSTEPIYIGMGSMERAFITKNRSDHWIGLTKKGYSLAIFGWYQSRAEAYEHEKRLIAVHKPVCNLVHNGYAGNLGNAWNVGRKHTAESKRIMSERTKLSWQKTRRNTGTRRPTKPIQCLDTGIIYNGLREASRQTGAHASSISSCINGRITKAAGLRFIRLEV